MTNQAVILEVERRHRGDVRDHLLHHPGWLPGETKYSLKRVSPTACTLTLITEIYRKTS